MFTPSVDNNHLQKRLGGGEKKEIEVGISIGIQDSIEELLNIVDRYVKQGYKRMKIKIKPGRDYELIRQVREKFPQYLNYGGCKFSLYARWFPNILKN